MGVGEAFGNGTKVRDYVYVDDVVAANVAALARGYGEIFNIASGVATTDHEVFFLLRQLLGKPGLDPGYAPKRPGEIDAICLDIRKALRGLGWMPKVPLSEGARQTVAAFQQAVEVVTGAG